MTDWQEDEIADLKNELSDADRIRIQAKRYIGAKVARLRLGVYDESREGDLLTVLEEIERILR